MAAMSTTFCTDWGSFQLLNNNPNLNPSPDYAHMFSFQTQQDELAAASILALDYSLALDDPNPLLLSQTFFSDQEFLLPLDDHEYYYHDEYPKRQKTHPQFNSSFNGFLPNPSMLPEFVQPQLPLPPPEVQIQQQPAAAQLYANCRLSNKDASTAAKMNNGNGGVSLSPQSIAARQRRRRITEKTNELVRLVPSGSKMHMNTAEMLQAAYKYIKFLKAQVAMLKLMDSVQEEKGQRLHNQEGLQVLASPIVQEKLYSEAKCLVSREFVGTLANNEDIQSKPLLTNNIAKLL